MNDDVSNIDKARILLVEDNAALRATMRRALVQDGSVVVEADSGDAALRVMDGTGPFDLLVTDVRMPGTHDGIALASRWQERTPGRPVLIVSGSVEDWLDSYQPSQGVVVLRKPFQRACLMRAVRHLLQGVRAAA